MSVQKPERAGRDGESQSLPTFHPDQPIIHSLVQQDLQSRLELGIRRYGTPLQPFNGRNALQDLYEELLDAAVYVKQALLEQECKISTGSSEDSAEPH